MEMLTFEGAVHVAIMGFGKLQDQLEQSFRVEYDHLEVLQLETPWLSNWGGNRHQRA